MKIGQGWDIHPLIVGRKLILGGVHIPFEKGLQGHSDADVLIHAIIDAILGAAGLGDIGQHFPDTDPQFSGVSSRSLLREVAELIQASGWCIGNIDASLLIERPKIAAYLPEMVHHIATDLGIEPDQVNVKAKTYEKLGPVGQSQAVEAQAICILNRPLHPVGLLRDNGAAVSKK